MPSITVRNVPEDVHRALRALAARHGRSVEAEIREILANALKPEGRVKLGSMLVGIGREAMLADEKFGVIEKSRDMAPAKPINFE